MKIETRETEKQIKPSTISKRIELIEKEAEIYKTQWRHKIPCEAWAKDQYCKHWVQAKYRRFKEDIDATFTDLDF